MAVHSRDGYNLVSVDNIIYCKADGFNTYLYLSDKKMVVSKSLGEMESTLPEILFERIPHSLLVNRRHITSLRKNDGLTTIMDNYEKLPVSRSKRERLMERMGIK